VSARRAAVGALAALALGTGLYVGLGTGTAAAGRAKSSTKTTPALPGVRTVTTPALSVTGLPGYGRPIVHLGDLNTPEQFILGQLYQLALEQQGYTVQLSRTVGAPAVQRGALRAGTLDVYPDYLGQWNSSMAHLHARYRTLSASYAAGSAYAKRHGFALLKPTPFSNTFGLAVTSQYAQENHIHSIADLTRGTGVILGAPLVFQTGTDGLPALASAYHLHLKPGAIDTIDDIGSQYGQLDSGNVQVVWVYTTDPELAGPEYQLLADPKHVFGFGNVVPVTTPAVLRAEGPTFRQTLNRVDALLTTSAMRGLNAEQTKGGHLPTPVAQQFLEGNRILPASQYAPVTATKTVPESASP
jgi:osmoprotectant transport system substrate-binding protein